MSEESNEKAFIEIIKLLSLFFDDNHDRMKLWLNLANPMFGGIPPIDLVKLGRASKVLKYMRAAAYEGGWL